MSKSIMFISMLLSVSLRAAYHEQVYIAPLVILSSTAPVDTHEVAEPEEQLVAQESEEKDTKKTLECPCGKTKYTTKELRAHIKQAHEDPKSRKSNRLYQCPGDACLKQHMHLLQLLKHIKKDHLGEVYVACPECPELSFSHQRLLDKHMQLKHMNLPIKEEIYEILDNPIECSCKVTCSNNKDFNKHMDAHKCAREKEDTTGQDKDMKDMFECPDASCKRTFERPGHLADHVRAKHAQQVLYRCKKCLKEYTYRASMSNHSIKCAATLKPDGQASTTQTQAIQEIIAVPEVALSELENAEAAIDNKEQKDSKELVKVYCSQVIETAWQEEISQPDTNVLIIDEPGSELLRQNSACRTN